MSHFTAPASASTAHMIIDADYAHAADEDGRIIGPGSELFELPFPREWWEACPVCDQPAWPLGLCLFPEHWRRVA